jgi:hypothetical protein
MSQIYARNPASWNTLMKPLAASVSMPSLALGSMALSQSAEKASTKKINN